MILRGAGVMLIVQRADWATERAFKGSTSDRVVAEYLPSTEKA